MRWAGALAGMAVLLTGCVPSLGGDGTGGAPAEAVVTSDLVVVTGPPGFCIDDGATRAEGDTAFVLLGNCAAISGSRRAAQPDVPVVLTAAISDASDEGSIAESVSDLDTYFRSEDGMRLLSRTQDPESVTILETAVRGDMFLLHATDTSAGAVEGVGDDYWRAYMDLGPRIATLSVLALEEAGVTREQSLATLMSFTGSVQAANGAASASVAAAAPPPRARSGGLFNTGLFQGILN